MSSTSTNKKTQCTTPEEQGSFLEFFKRIELVTTAERHQALRASHPFRPGTVKALATLKSPKQFCNLLLTKALSDKLGEPLDIRDVAFQSFRSISR